MASKVISISAVRARRPRCVACGRPLGADAEGLWCVRCADARAVLHPAHDNELPAERRVQPAETFPTDREAFGRELRAVVRRYVEWLEDDGIAEPLAERIQLAAMVDDLCALVGVVAPTAVTQYVG